MKSTKHLGIWMDHSIAYLNELTNGTIIATNTIESQPKLQVKEEDLYFKDESHMLNKEQKQRAAFYKRISDVITGYEEVILFGPTEAKNELLNLLRANHLFDKIKIEIKTTDKMTENQQHDFVKGYFHLQYP